MPITRLSETQTEYVRIIIGKSERKLSGVKKPIKTITLAGTTVNEIYEMVDKMLKEKKI